MKKHVLLPFVCLISGAAALAIRLMQNRTGFEIATGLPIAGNLYAVLLPVWLVLTAVVLIFLTCPFRSCEIPVFPQDFSTKNSFSLTIPITGALLTGLSGMIPALANISSGAASFDTQVSATQLIFAATALLPALALLSAFFACGQQNSRKTMRISQKFDTSTLLLIPPVGLIIRLVLTYRICSVDPVLERYYLQLLALAFLTLAYFFFAAFAIGSGQPFRFAFCAGLTVVLSAAVLADGGALSELLFYIGNAITLLGALLLLPCQSSSTDS